ncbi:DegT/DnrJ/EryC1/StrS family aminotransferase [Patescibacteria group bacterium]|nr:DegT/DnrJ/EryC1/StrS family aminotransferase [Patescibacteria group bacterium]
MKQLRTNEFYNEIEFEKIFPPQLYENFNSELPAPLNGRTTIFTLYGRNALYLGAREMLNLTKRNIVLVPAYSCGDEIAPFVASGCRIKAYRVHPETLQVDKKDIEQKLDQNVSAVLITHYFGFPQKEIEIIKKICGERGVVLIEDCAHAFAGGFKNIPLGAFGDFSIFSLRKFLPIPHGGALVINNTKINRPNPLPPPATAVNLDLFLYSGYQAGIFTRGINIQDTLDMVGVKQKDLHGPRLKEFGGYNLGLSNVAKVLIAFIAKQKLWTKRRSNFLYYLDFFEKNSHKSVQPLFEFLEKGVVPLFFPVLVNDSEEIYKRLRDKGLFAGQPFWSDSHTYFNWADFSPLNELKKKVMVLPVNHRVHYRDLKRFLEVSDYR